MKVLKISLIIVGVLIAIVLIFFWYIGMFSSVTVVERQAGGYKIAGKEFVGQYSKVGPTMTEVDKTLREMGVNCMLGFGIYYDNPQTTPIEKCRSFVGNIIEEKDFTKLPEMQTKGLRVDSVPMASAMVVDFDTPNSLSYMIGPMKAYPALSKYAAAKGYKLTMAIEVYDMPNKKTHYIMQYTK